MQRALYFDHVDMRTKGRRKSHLQRSKSFSLQIHSLRRNFKTKFICTTDWYVFNFRLFFTVTNTNHCCEGCQTAQLFCVPSHRNTNVSVRHSPIMFSFVARHSRLHSLITPLFSSCQISVHAVSSSCCEIANRLARQCLWSPCLLC